MAIDTRRLILEKSYVLFQRQGYSATSMRQIALACGISVGNLCYHFKKKEDLFMSFYMELFTTFSQNLGPTSDVDLDPWVGFIAREYCFLYKCAFDSDFRDSYTEAINIPTLRDEYIRLHDERFRDIFGPDRLPAATREVHTASVVVCAAEFQLMDAYARHGDGTGFDDWFAPVFHVHMGLLGVPQPEQDARILKGFAVGKEIYGRTVFDGITT